MRDYVDRETVAHNVLMALHTNGQVMNAIFNTPIADVAPVKHGRWIKYTETTDDGETMRWGWECSLCGRWREVKDPFCGCGARMDGDADAD